MSLVLTMDDESWEAHKRQYKQRLTTIVIPLDISAGVAKGLLSRIDSFFSEIRIDLAELQGQKERIDNIVREWEREKANGGNEIQRKQNATKAIQAYPLPNGQTTNLYEVQRSVTERTSYLQGILDVLNGKQSRLITVTGVLKLEKELQPFASID